MIASIKGEVLAIKHDRLIIENQGIGYNVFVPTFIITDVAAVGSDIMLYTYMNVKEDSITLFGFDSEDALDTFKLLIGVNSVGPKMGLAILSRLSVAQLSYAVEAEDAKLISATPGVGLKTAQKIILELKGKLTASVEDVVAGEKPAAADELSGARLEAVKALLGLGLTRKEAEAAVKTVDAEVTDPGKITALALRNR